MRKLAQRTEAVVSLRALEKNVLGIRKRLGREVEIMAVLKGDGYGHGEKGIYPTLKKCGIERYAVAVGGRRFAQRSRLYRAYPFAR